MAETGHEHSHHGLHSGRDVVSTLVLLALGAVDLLLGLVLVNPALVAEAGHNAFDALYTLATAVLKRLTRGSGSHRLQEHMPLVVGIVLCALTVIVTGVLTVVEVLKSDGYVPHGAVITAAMGMAGFTINYGLSRLMRHGTSGYDHANATHLLSDAKASLVLVACGAVAGLLHNVHEAPRWTYLAGAVIIVALIARDNFRTSAKLWYQLRDCLSRDAS